MARLKAPDKNLDAERLVLGSIIKEPNIFFERREIILPQLFTTPMHRSIIKAIAALADERGDFGIPALISKIPETDGEQSVSGYLWMLRADQADPASAVDSLEDLREAWARREMLALSEHLVKAATEPSDMTAQERLDRAVNRVGVIGSTVEQIDESDSARALDRVIARVDGTPRKKKQLTDMVPWVWPELANVMGGNIEFGWFVGLLSDSRAGKTSLALQQSYATARRGIPVLFLTEMKADDCYIQMASQILEIQSQEIRRGALSAENRDLTKGVLNDFRALPLKFIQIEAPTVKTLGRWVRDYARKHGRFFCVIDHEDVIEANNPRDDLNERLRQIDRDLKAVVTKVECACLYLMHRNAQGSMRDNARPIDRDVVGGARRLKSFDALIYLYREWIWLQQQIRVAPTKTQGQKDALLDLQGRADKVEDIAEFGGMKARFGKQGLIETIKWDAPHTRFYSEQQEKSHQAPELDMDGMSWESPSWGTG